MVRVSKWGTRTFLETNKEDTEVKKEIFRKLVDLGENGDSKGPGIAKPEQIHALHPSWQPYNAKSFGEVVRRCRKVISTYALKFLS